MCLHMAFNSNRYNSGEPLFKTGAAYNITFRCACYELTFTAESHYDPHDKCSNTWQRHIGWLQNATGCQVEYIHGYYFNDRCRKPSKYIGKQEFGSRKMSNLPGLQKHTLFLGILCISVSEYCSPCFISVLL